MRFVLTMAMVTGVVPVVLAGAEASAEEIALWPEGLPAGAKPVDPQRARALAAKSDAEWIRYVEKPTLTVFMPQGRRVRTAVVVCPGGGYNGLAWNKEGVEIARWLNTLGITAFVLKYRVPRRDPKTPWFEPLQDAQRAIRYVRAHADRWGVDPARVGILGFSAGGHLAAMAGMHWDKPAYAARDAIDRLSPRPDFCVLVYAAYLGDAADPTRLSALVKVTEQTPPMFMAVTWDDKLRGLHAALLLAELKKAGVAAECHVFSYGGHGYALRPSKHPVARAWPRLCAAWLRELGFLPLLVPTKADSQP